MSHPNPSSNPHSQHHDAQAHADAIPDVSADFRRRALYVVLVVTLVAVALFLTWTLKWTLALVFAAVLVAVFLSVGADLLKRVLHVSRAWGLAIFTLLLLIGTALFVVLAVPSLSEQVSQLQTQLPQSIDTLRGWAMQYEWGKWLLESDGGPNLDETLQGGGGMARRAVTAFGSIVTAFVTLVFLGFTGLYLAAKPGLYQRGVLWLFPPAGRRKADDVLKKVARSLRFWLYGQLLAMVLVGVLSGLGLWALGVPLPLVNAVITMLLTFIPNFGPVASAVPPALLALTAEGTFIEGGPGLALAVLALYFAIQALESYLITPMIQMKAVELPPALLITTQIMLGVLLGIVGIAIAAPLTAAGMVIARELFVVGDVHHEHPKDREHERDQPHRPSD